MVNKLINEERTGTPGELAIRLGVSRRQLFRLLELLRDWEAPLRYSKSLSTYYYDGSFDLEIKFSIKVITDTESKKIHGGLNKYHRCLEMALSNYTLIEG